MKYITLLLTLALCGCTQNIDLDPGRKNEVVVNCLLTHADTQKLFLTYSNPYGQHNYDEIEQAKATLLENGVLVGEFVKKGYKEWQLSFTPRSGMDYELQIEVEGMPLVTATTTMPGYPKVMGYKERNTETAKYFKQVENQTYWVFAFDKLKDTVMLPMVKILKSFSLLSTIGTNYDKVDEFNVTDSYRHGATTKSYRAYIRLKPSNIDMFYVEGHLATCLIVFRAASTEYDQYLKSSLEKMFVYNAFDDPSQWLDESDIYTNITNGLGVFGAYADRLFNYNQYMIDQ